MITDSSQLELLKSKDTVEVGCSRCAGVIKLRVSSLRHYFRHKGNQYVCHHCKVKENGPLIGAKIRANARRKGFVVSDLKNEKCVICGNVVEARIKNINSNKKRNGGNYHCVSCSLKRAHEDGKFVSVYTSGFKKKLKVESKKFWDENRNTWKSRIVTDQFRKGMSIYGKRAWVVDEYRKKMLKSRSSPEFRAKLSRWSKMAWTDEFRERMSSVSSVLMSERGKLGWEKLRGLLSEEEIYQRFSNFGKMAWSDGFKIKMAKIRLNQPKTSSQQRILYSTLDDLGVEFNDDCSPLCQVGFYTFDCRIDPQVRTSISRPLLIEVQGDYWHSIPRTVSKDKSKATYLKTYFPEFDLKYLWEHEFNNKDRIVSLLKYWLKIDKGELRSFVFSDVVGKEVVPSEAELFISKYHYAGRLGRSGLNFGYYLGDELIAVIVYANPVRQETASRLGVPYKDVLELSRLAIHPEFQVKNFASFLISLSINSIRSVRPWVKKLVSFADTTHNHNGTVYKASNWKLDGIVKPDYWYADNEGYICHKKTLWNHAKKMSMTEGEYCEKYNYVKVWGDKKFRYVFDLCV